MSQQIEMADAPVEEQSARPSGKYQRLKRPVERSALRPQPQSRPAVRPDESPLRLDETQTASWQNIIWREWCRAKDDDYAYYLFDLVKSTSLGQPFVIGMALLGVILGGLLGYIFGSMISAELNVTIGYWQLRAAPPWILGWSLGLAGGLFGVEASRKYRAWHFWWQGQPTAGRVERALQQAVTHHPGAAEVWSAPLERLQHQKETAPPLEQLVAALDSGSWTDRFAARHALIARGGEATEALRQIATDRTNPQWETAIWLLASIERDTANHFAWRVNQVQCPFCQTRFAVRPVDVGVGIPINYYGCRSCGQSLAFLYVTGGVVAVLDEMWPDELAEHEGLLRINWLVRRTLFDFDRVEIVQAGDEAVERFAVQVGNDTDPYRRARYPHITCTIDPSCNLSKNTLRILQRTFGNVTQR